MPIDDISAMILNLIIHEGNDDLGFTEQEIISQLPEFSPEQVKDSLESLIHSEDVFLDNSSNQPRYNLTERIAITENEKLSSEISKHSDLWLEDEAIRTANSQRIIERIAEKSAIHTVAESYTEEEGFASLVRDVAVQIANEDPTELILDMLEWIVSDINTLADTMAIDLANKPKEVRKVAREIAFRTKKVKRLFQNLFRLDDGVILTIPDVKNMERRQARIRWDKNKARIRLNERIYGQKFINFIEVPENTHLSAIGTDASIGDVTISHARGSFIPPVPASLFVAGAAMRVKQKNGSHTSLQYWDYDIDPREVEQFTELQAAEEGLFISPNLKGEVITDFQHLSIAAMERRQYLEELRIVTNQANWHPFGDVPEMDLPPRINLIFRDGRIFPLVHRIEDYEGASAPDDLLYGTIVRNEIDTFYRVFHNTVGRGKTGATYAGAVKAPAFSWLAMIVFWYLYKIKEDENLRSKCYRPPLNDQAVAHLLFWGICKEYPEFTTPDSRYALITFQTIRRFSDIAFLAHPIVYRVNDERKQVDETSEDDWLEYIRYHIADVDESHRNHRRGLGSLGSVKEYYDFIDLCRRASVAMFYGTPCRLYNATINHNAHALLPRWEVALDISNRNNFQKRLDQRLVALLMWITDPDGLDSDGKHAVGGFAEVSSSLPLMIPDVVAAAHEVVTFTRTEHVRMVEDIIYKLIRLLRMNR